MNNTVDYKDYIIDYLYNNIDINEHRYIIIKNYNDILNIKNQYHYCISNSHGINSFIIFTKKNNTCYSYLVDRRSLSFNKQSCKIDKIRITQIKLSVDIKFYDGTIIDGIVIDNENNKINNKNISLKTEFMINDVFMLCGKKMTMTNYKKKMYTVKNVFDNLVKPTSQDNINLYIPKVYELNEINDLFKENFSFNSKKFNIKGISFLPEKSGTKLIYIFDKIDETFKNELIKDEIRLIKNENIINDKIVNSTNITDKKIYTFEVMNSKYIDNIILNFEMVKTNISDIYKLYSIFQYNDTYIKKKIGAAYIPTYELSLKCKLYFMNKDSNIMSCKLNSKKKWIPINIADIQKIDIITNDRRLQIIENCEDDVVINDNLLNK